MDATVAVGYDSLLLLLLAVGACRYAQLQGERQAQLSQQAQQQSLANEGEQTGGSPGGELVPPQRCQIVCMSATLPGIERFARCIGARQFVSKFRPVNLEHHLVSE
jgi:hypothetical protein